MRAQDRDLAVTTTWTGEREHTGRRRQTEMLWYLPFQSGIGEKAASDLGIHALFSMKILTAL